MERPPIMRWTFLKLGVSGHGNDDAPGEKRHERQQDQQGRCGQQNRQAEVDGYLKRAVHGSSVV